MPSAGDVIGLPEEAQKRFEVPERSAIVSTRALALLESSPVALASAIVCTRNRAEHVVATVRSLLDASGDSIEVILVDQSDDDATKRALAPWSDDPRFRYLASQTHGKGTALNEGLHASRGTVLVCTDDDVIVPPHWAADMARVLESQPSAGVLYCRVAAVPHDTSAGYVPSYDPPATRLVTSIAELRNGTGLGAAMGLRRDFVEHLGGFDDFFGPGGRFPSADEFNLSIRALLSGWHVYETAELSVVHDGFRTFAQGKEHARRDWVALGACFAKPLRARRLSAAIIPLWFFPRRALFPPLFDLLRLRRPRGVGRILAFVEGFADGLKTAVDPATLRFKATSGSRP